MNRKVTRKITALAALSKSGKIERKYAFEALEKISNINDLLRIIHSGIGPPILRFALPIFCNHKDCTIQHLYDLFMNYTFDDYQILIADALVSRNDLSAPWVSEFLSRVRGNNVEFHIISQLGRDQTRQTLLIDVFALDQRFPYDKKRLAEAIMRHPLAYKYADILLATDDLDIQLSFAVAMAKTATDATSEDFFQLFELISGNVHREAAFVSALRMPDSELLLRILIKTGLEKTRAACVGRMHAIEITPNTFDCMIRYCANHHGELSKLIKSIILEKYTLMPVERLLDMLWNLEDNTADSYKRNMLYEVLQSHTDQLFAVAGIAQK